MKNYNKVGMGENNPTDAPDKRAIGNTESTLPRKMLVDSKSGLTLRKTPKQDGAINVKKILSHNDEVMVLSICDDSEWCKISVENTGGFVMSKFLTEV